MDSTKYGWADESENTIEDPYDDDDDDMWWDYNQANANTS